MPATSFEGSAGVGSGVPDRTSPRSVGRPRGTSSSGGGVADRLTGAVAGFAVGSRSDMADTPAVAATITAAATSRATRAPNRIFNLVSRWVAHRLAQGADVAASGTFVLACGHFAAGLR